MDQDQEPPTSLVHIQASEVFPKKSLRTDDESSEIPFPELSGESVEFLGSTSNATIAISNFRLFIHMKDSFVNVPLRLIESIEVRDLCFLHVNCKDAKSIRIVFDSNEQCFIWHKRLCEYASSISQLEDLFCFPFYAWSQSSHHGGSCEEGYCTDLSHPDNNIQNIFMSEVRRMGFDTQPTWRITDINSDFSVCRTYPKLHIVPKCITDQEIEKVASFRSSGRFPSVVWRHMTNGAVIARSSQPEIGWFGWRNDQDECLLKALGTACACDAKPFSNEELNNKDCEKKMQSSDVKLDSTINGHSSVHMHCSPGGNEADDVESCQVLILDARSYTAALANRAKGGGCEYAEYYPSCEVQFMNLANIHGIRKSFQGLRTLCSGPKDQPKWYSMLESTNWLHHISMLIKAALTVVNAVHHDKRPVLVHCSDGWDRTPQIVALAELLLDPYYRTIEGFQVLIEREWLEFGHRFADRCGHGHDTDENQRCPVFLQWLDCVHQLTRQFPCSFEFSETLLVKLVEHTYTCLFGTFLCNSEQERLREGVKSKTCSFWSLVRPKRKEFTNFLYSPNSEQVLEPSASPQSLVLWSSIFCSYPTRFSDSAELAANSHSEQTTMNGNASGHSRLSRVHSCCSYGTVQKHKQYNDSNMQPSKSDGELAALSREQKDYIHDCVQRTRLNHIDLEMSTAFCSACKSSLGKDISMTNGESSSYEKDEHCASTGDQCFGNKSDLIDASIVSCETNTSDINDSMTSSTATVILSCSELQDDNSKVISESGSNGTVEEVPGTVSGPSEEPAPTLDNLPTEITGNGACDDTGEKSLKEDEIYKNSVNAFKEVSTEHCILDPVVDSSDILKDTKPSSSITLKAVSSDLFSKYLDIDGLTLVTDVVQHRLRQIHAAHQHCVNLLHSQLIEEHQRASCGHNSGLGSPQRASDLADEICSLPDSNGSTDHPSLSGCSTDENSWIHVEQKDSEPTLWVPDHLATHCAKCDAKFWVANRKHHCRNCGRVFCSTCSDNALPVPSEQLYDPVRVCITCFEKLVSFQQRENGGRRHLDNMSTAGS